MVPAAGADLRFSRTRPDIEPTAGAARSGPELPRAVPRPGAPAGWTSRRQQRRLV